MTSSALHLPLAAYVGIAALVAWRMVSRVRRLMGRQRLSTVRAWITAVLVPLALVALMFAFVNHPLSALWLAAGTAVGAGLGRYGLKLTRFEVTPLGRFYTPSAHIGIALSVLLFSRLAYRGYQLYDLSLGGASHADFARSPWTLVILGTMAGYYAAYAIGLLRWNMRTGVGPADDQPPM